MDAKELYVDLQKLEEQVSKLHKCIWNVDSLMEKIKVALKKELGK